MAFAFDLQDSLLDRDRRIAIEFAAGESLEAILSRALLAVESAADTRLLTSILLLDEGGRHLWHGAAPSLPKDYCDAIDGTEIGPDVGSCGTAAFFGRAVYVTDVATDPLWKDFRDLALEHGLRACWSTPIRGANGAMLGTFAVYHPEPGSPTAEEIEAIRLITRHVAQAIEWSRDRQDLQARGGHLKLVSTREPDETLPPTDAEDGRAFSIHLQRYAEQFDRYAAMVESEELAGGLKNVARDCRNLMLLVSRWSELEDRQGSASNGGD